MANMDNIVLTGDIRHQANQLFNILRERELSPEQLEKILPVTKDFLSQFNAVLREQIEAGKECHKNTIKTLQLTLEKLTDQLESQATPEQKEQILKAIYEIQKSIKEIEINRENKDNIFKMFISFLATIVMIVVIIISGKKLGDDNKA